MPAARGCGGKTDVAPRLGRIGGLGKGLQLGLEVLQAVEVSVHRCEPDRGHAVEPSEGVKRQLADALGIRLATLPAYLRLDPVRDRLELRDAHGALGRGPQ